MNYPRITAIICHHKGNLVLRAIQSVLNSKFVIPEIIVATSSPNTNFHSVKTIFIQGGPAKKRNIAYRYSTNNVIAFFDDDVEVTPNCLFEMHNTLKTSGTGMVFGKTLNMEHRSRFDEAGSYLTSTGFLYARAQSGIEDVGQFDVTVPVLAGKSASCMIRKEAFVEAGFFDESYEILGEETDLAWRVWLKGYQVFYEPRSVAYHAFNTRYKPIDFYTHERIYFNGCRNYLAMLTTNLEKKNLMIVIPCQLIAWFVSAFGFLITGKLKASCYVLKGLWYWFTHFDVHLEKRNRVQKTRMINDENLFRFVKLDPPISYYIKRLLRYVSVGLHG